MDLRPGERKVTNENRQSELLLTAMWLRPLPVVGLNEAVFS